MFEQLDQFIVFNKQIVNLRNIRAITKHAKYLEVHYYGEENVRLSLGDFEYSEAAELFWQAIATFKGAMGADEVEEY